MPEDSKVPDSVPPQPEGAKAPAETPAPVKPETVPAAPKVAAEEAKAPAPAAAVAAPAGDSKPTAAPAAKPAAPAAKPPAAPAKPAGPVPEPWESELIASLRHQYGSGIVEASRYLGQRYVIVDSSILADILLRMRDAEGFDYCVDITAVHYPKREQQFDVLYVLYSFPHNERIRVKTRIKDGEHVPSAVSVWETANWLEREVFDMFGIVFDGHPGLKRILLPDDWHGHPLRKDYDILQQDKEWVQINLGIESGQ
ncbi:MAG: NADH-quinone oxidoreductase subunit C [Candidatus Korobacteraceae bacterium]